MMGTTTEIFCCYAHEDEQLLSALKKHLVLLEREGLIKIWHDSDIHPGAEWEKEINTHLDTADIFLFLVSPNSLSSTYCYSREMKRAMERYEQGDALIVPIILRPVAWQNSPFGKLQALPTGAKPIIDPNWHTLDSALVDVVAGIRRIVTPLLIKHSLAQGNTERNQHHYKAALSTYEHVIDLDPNCADAFLGQGKALEALDKNREALAAYNQAIRLNAEVASYYAGKAQVLLNMYRYEEALEALIHATMLEPTSEWLYIQQGNVFQYLNRYEEALEAYNTAINLNCNIDPHVYHQKGVILEHLARQAHNRARQHGYTTKDQNSLQELNAALENLSNEMVGGLEKSMLVKNILEAITRALGADASSLYLIEPGTRLLSIYAATGYHSVLVAIKVKYDLDQIKGVTAWIARTGQKFIAQNRDKLHRHPEWEGKYMMHQGGREPNAFLGIPLKFLDATGKEKVIGVLKIEDIRDSSHREPYFTDHEILLAEAMGSVIPIIVQSALLNDIHLRELNVDLRTLSGAMVGGLDMDVLVTNTVDTIAKVLGADASSLFLIDPTKRTLTIQAATGYQSILVTEQAQYNLQDEGITAFIARSGQRVTAKSKEELRQNQAWIGKYTTIQEGREPNSFLGIPLKVLVLGGGEETIGVLKIEDIRPNPRHPESYFTDQDIILVEMMGNIITTVIQNTRLNEIRLHELNEGLKTLSRAMVGGLDMNVLVERIVETIREVLGADASSLYLIEPGTRILSIQAATGYHSVLVDIGARYDLDCERGVTAFIARTGKRVTARNKEELHRERDWEGKYKMHQGGREPNAFLGIPLKFLEATGKEKVIGVLKIEDIRSPSPYRRKPYFTDQEILLAEMMGSVITTVIQNMRLAAINS